MDEGTDGQTMKKTNAQTKGLRHRKDKKMSGWMKERMDRLKINEWMHRKAERLTVGREKWMEIQMAQQT